MISHADGVDPVGACVGPRGSRVRMVVSELRGEKIDIIPYNEEPARFVAKALSPARVREVLVDDEDKQATVIVPDDQLSLAIGRDGQNARLAAKLTGWRVDIKSETEFSEVEDEMEFDEGEGDADGRCAAVLSAGRRCPNASLPGSRYCGLPQHQALARFATNQSSVLSALTEEEIETLADPDADDDEVRPLVEKADGGDGRGRGRGRRGGRGAGRRRGGQRPRSRRTGASAEEDRGRRRTRRAEEVEPESVSRGRRPADVRPRPEDAARRELTSRPRGRGCRGRSERTRPKADDAGEEPARAASAEEVRPRPTRPREAAAGGSDVSRSDGQEARP